MHKLTHIFVFLLVSVGMMAQPITSLTGNPALRDAAISVLVKNLSTGETVDAYNPNMLLTPASCMKLVSTAAALELMGPDYRYPTYLETDGHIVNGVLQGNLFVRGTGDPSLGSSKKGNPNQVLLWVKELKKLGIQRITGSVIADLSAFSHEAINPAWLWEDIGNYYAPGIYGLTYMDNTLQITLSATASGQHAQVVRTYPDYPGLEFDNHLATVAHPLSDAYVHGVPFCNTRYLSGEVRANTGQFGLKGDMPNPGWYLAYHLTKALRDASVPVQGEPGYRCEASGQKTSLYVHYSRPLSELVAETNIHSNNQYAEQIFRSLGMRKHEPASIQDALEVERACWDARAVSFTSARIYDGCGLAPLDAVSAEQFVSLLSYMNESRNQEAFYASLPVSGVSGTLRSLLGGTALEGRVHAKSGTITGVKSYAGYIEMPNGERLAFAVIVNNSLGKMRVAQAAIGNYLLALYQSQLQK